MSQPPNPDPVPQPDAPPGWPSAAGGPGAGQGHAPGAHFGSAVDPTQALPVQPAVPPTQALPVIQPAVPPTQPLPVVPAGGYPPPGAPAQPGPSGAGYGSPWSTNQAYGQPGYPPGGPIPPAPYGPAGPSAPGGYGFAGASGPAGAQPPGGYGQPPYGGQPAWSPQLPPQQPPPRSKVPLIVAGALVGVVALGGAGWALTRPAATPTAAPSVVRTTSVPTVQPSVSVSPTQAPTEQPSPTPSYVPTPGVCHPGLTKGQCKLAQFASMYVAVETCVADNRYGGSDAVACNPGLRAAALKGKARVYLLRTKTRTALSGELTDFFRRAGTRPYRSWPNPPSQGIWWTGSKSSGTKGAIAVVKTKTEARMAWTYYKNLYYIQITSKGGTTTNLLNWWAKA